MQNTDIYSTLNMKFDSNAPSVSKSVQWIAFWTLLTPNLARMVPGRIADATFGSGGPQN